MDGQLSLPLLSLPFPFPFWSDLSSSHLVGPTASAGGKEPNRRANGTQPMFKVVCLVLENCAERRDERDPLLVDDFCHCLPRVVVTVEERPRNRRRCVCAGVDPKEVDLL